MSKKNIFKNLEKNFSKPEDIKGKKEESWMIMKKLLLEGLQRRYEKDLQNYQEAPENIKNSFYYSLKKVCDFLDKIGIDYNKLSMEDYNIFVDKSMSEVAYYDVYTKSIFVNDEENLSEEELEQNLMHEIVHSLSSQHLGLTGNLKKGPDNEFYGQHSAKVGFGFFKSKFDGNGVFNGFFKGVAFNEGLTEHIASNIYYEDNLQERMVSYKDEVILVETIMKKIYTKDDGEFDKSEWKEFIQAFFGGNIFVLKRIEKEYGSGSLKLLFSILTKDAITSLHLSKDTESTYLSQRSKKIEFFTTDNENRREELRREFLGEKDK